MPARLRLSISFMAKANGARGAVIIQVHKSVMGPGLLPGMVVTMMTVALLMLKPDYERRWASYGTPPASSGGTNKSD